MKTLTIKNALVATSLLMSSAAMADFVSFDVDGTGASHTPRALFQFNLTTLASFDPIIGSAVDKIVQDLGTDGIMNSGDGFTESLSYRVPNAQFLDGFQTLPNEGGSAGFYTVEMDLVGHIDSFMGNGGVDITTDSATWGALSDATFDIIFDFADSAVELIWNNTDVNSSTIVGAWDVLGGGADQIAPNTGGQDFLLALAFDDATSDDHFFSSDGALISESIAMNQAFGTGTALAHPIGITSATGNALNISSTAGNAAMRFSVPEPTSIAILGLGLLGFAGARRRKS
ncbi:MAG: PEP-CTERM sorting domain-containing protein [Colwellia sp.]|nr:PEP-CTERM sorting domain-containing protein [Colwellia sp.]